MSDFLRLVGTSRRVMSHRSYGASMEPTQQPENDQDDDNQTEDAAEPAASITAVSIVAAATA